MRLTIGMMPPVAACHWRATLAQKAADVIIRRRSEVFQAGDISAMETACDARPVPHPAMTARLQQKSQQLQKDALSLSNIALIGRNTTFAVN
jgi:hypothetical protein